MSEVKLSSPVSVIYGIGPEAQKRLNRLEIFTVYDLISYLPVRYNDWSRTGHIGELQEGSEMSFTADVTTSPVRKGYKKTSPVSFYVSDGTGRIELSFFNSPYLLDKFAKGSRVFVHGVPTYYGGHFQMVNPHVEDASDLSSGRLIRPVYSLTAGLTSAKINTWVKTALKLTSSKLRNVIPSELSEREGLMSVSEAYEKVHFPDSIEDALNARRRIAYEELILLGIGIRKFIKGDEDLKAPVVIPKSSDLFPEGVAERWKAVLGNLGFELTDDQKRTLADIQKDLMSDKPMNRLVQGDVGSGKTAVAILSMAMTALMGKQAVLLAPTSVLAKQHYDSAQALLKGSGINVALLLGKTKASLKKEIKEQLRNNEASVIIGTHAVLSDDVSFKDLALVIADEQHRFGVKQREKLLVSREEQNLSVHNLVMTATPIPRTLAMVVYGDMDTSVIKQKPKGRSEIKTYFLPSTESSEIYRVIRAKLTKGEQVYIVCSKIDDEHEELYSNVFDDKETEEQGKAISVMDMAKKLEDEGIASEYKCEVLYGSMNEKDKLATMERFLSRETALLVSTTVIEVGVNNPNATLMIVMDAERFGLSTLHQLRGRIGRGTLQSYCVLASESRTERALTRMKLMCESTDGFELAQKDLELRGPGDFFGTRQHGIPQLRAANLYTDTDLANTAREEVNEVLDKGGEEAETLLENIRVMFDLRFKDKMGNL
ncbi:MAG: ATP-dependent DNA helicase RecG [Clostridiales bacterium]|nr:ATP-dependent DNA helicase RecG [Clostridiales bacterium]